MSIDLSGDIATGINGAFERGCPIVVGYVNGQDEASLSMRGSAHVHSPNQIAIWARSTDSGIAASVGARPNVSLLLFATNDGGPKMLLSVKGKARVDASQNDAVYNAMPAPERERDAEKKGVAIIVDVDSVGGVNFATGPISQSR